MWLALFEERGQTFAKIGGGADARWIERFDQLQV
jgi:hypothetical protein